MSRFRRIIFLDEENTRLSPFAAALFAKKYKESGAEERITILSRGNVVLFPEPANQNIALAAAAYGISLENHRATQFGGDEFGEDALLLTMDAASKRRVYNHYAGAANVFTLREYVDEAGDIRFPIGGGERDYAAVCAQVAHLLDGLVEKLRKESET